MTDTTPAFEQHKLMFAILNLSASVDAKTRRLIDLAEETKRVADALTQEKAKLSRCTAKANTLGADVSL